MIQTVFLAPIHQNLLSNLAARGPAALNLILPGAPSKLASMKHFEGLHKAAFKHPGTPFVSIAKSTQRSQKRPKPSTIMLTLF